MRPTQAVHHLRLRLLANSQDSGDCARVLGTHVSNGFVSLDILTRSDVQSLVLEGSSKVLISPSNKLPLESPSSNLCGSTPPSLLLERTLGPANDLHSPTEALFSMTYKAEDEDSLQGDAEVRDLSLEPKAPANASGSDSSCSFQCGLSSCRRSFKTRTALSQHHRIHVSLKPYLCLFCHKSFARKSNLSLHMRTHTKQRPYACPKCDHRFADKSAYNKHVQAVHNPDRPEHCPYCPQRRPTVRHLSNHFRIFFCNLCQSGFQFRAQLERHRPHCRKRPSPSISGYPQDASLDDNARFASSDYLLSSAQLQSAESDFLS